MFDCPHKGCGKIYSTKYSLQRHSLISHRKSKRYTCKICKKILSSNQNLKEHVFTHSQEKPLHCTFPGCHKTFRQSSQLSIHKKIHKSGSLNGFQHFSKMLSKVYNIQLKEIMEGLDSNEETIENEFYEIPQIFDPKELLCSLVNGQVKKMEF